MKLIKTGLSYAGRPIVRNQLNQLYYVISKHRTLKGWRDQNAKRDHSANLGMMGKMYVATYRMTEDKEQDTRRRLGLIR